jgi:proline iminopeptidase
MRIALEDELRLYVDVDGAGLRPDGPSMREVPTLILLHGGPGFDHSSFKAFFPRLSDRLQLIYYDHRGMGRSDGSDPGDWNLDTWAGDLARLIDLLGLERPLLFGQSFGGYVALRYAIEHSADLGGLVLSSTGARHVADDCLEAFARLGGDEARTTAADFFSDPDDRTFARYSELCMPLYNTTPQDHDIRQRQILTPKVLYHFWAGEFRRFDFMSELRRISCPTLVLAGVEDPITPPPRALEMADALDSQLARVELIPSAGHGVYRDAPAAFAETLTDFIGAVTFGAPAPSPFAL